VKKLRIKTKLILTLTLVCTLLFAQGQNGTPADKPVWVRGDFMYSDITENVEAFITQDLTFNVQNLPSQKFFPAAENIKKIESTRNSGKCRIFFKFSLAHDNTKTDSLALFFGHQALRATLLKQVNNNIFTVSEKVNFFDGYLPFEMRMDSSTTYFAEVDFAINIRNTLGITLVKNKWQPAFDTERFRKIFKRQIGSYVVSGAVLLMVMFVLLSFVFRIRRESSFYLGFLITTFFLVFLSTYLDNRIGYLATYYFAYFDFCLFSLGTIYYVLFKISFFDSKVQYPLLHKYFVFELYLTIAAFLFSLLASLFSFSFSWFSSAEAIFKIVMVITGIGYCVIAFKQKNTVINYFSYGYVGAIICWTFALFLSVSHIRSDNLFLSYKFFYEFGFVFSIMGYLFAQLARTRMQAIQRANEEQEMKMEKERLKFVNELVVVKAQEEERKRISADMHDDLGAGMTSIRLYTELAKAKIGAEVPELNKISKNANEVLEKMNAIIWSMNSEHDTLENLIAYVRNFYIDFFEDTNIEATIALPDQIPHINVIGQTRRNGFLIIRESLNNIVKHANASKVHLEVTMTSDRFTCVIFDNGIGLPSENLNRFGNGLKNIKKRCEDSLIEFFMETGNGTKLTFIRQIEPETVV
jgi:signal transduction histidine kinase